MARVGVLRSDERVYVMCTAAHADRPSGLHEVCNACWAALQADGARVVVTPESEGDLLRVASELLQY